MAELKVPRTGECKRLNNEQEEIIEKLREETKLLKEKLEESKQQMSDELAKVQKELEEFKRCNDTERLKAEEEHKKLVETLRQPAATRKDVEELLSSQYTSYKEHQTELIRSLLSRLEECKSEEREWHLLHLKEQNAALLGELKLALEQNKSKCQEDAEECKLLRIEQSRLQVNFKNACDYIEKLRQEKLRDQEYAAQLNSRECQQCAVLANKASVLEEQLDRGCRKKSTLLQQSDLCEDMKIEYVKLLTSFGVLSLVDNLFNDNFEAKGFLCDIFIDCYEKCKDCLMEIVCKNLGELFQVQTEDHRTDAMEDLSHVFWQLLQTTGIKTLVTKEQVVADLHKRVKDDIPKLPRFKRAKGDIAAATEKLPLDQFVKLAWKFVTQPYPVIVTTPVRRKMDDQIHKTSFKHWKEEKDGERPIIIYSQPVVYRSYHGEVLVKGFVGNVP